MTASMNNGVLYIAGGGLGSGGATIKDDVLYATVNSDGSLGSFTTNTSRLASVRTTHAGAIYNGWLYVTTGCSVGNVSNCTTYSNTSERMHINNGGPGTTGTWTQSANTFTNARWGTFATAYNGYLYVIGGCGDNNASATCASNFQYDDVQYVPLNADGSLGTWVTGTSHLHNGPNRHGGPT